MTSEPRLRRSRTLVIAASIFALLLAAQWLLFAAYVRREIAWAYPPHFDQTMSLFTAYRTYEGVREHGLVSALGRTLRDSPASGATLHIEAVLLFLGVGPSRLAALAVNWLHFALLQTAVVAALWRAGRWEMPVLGLGLLLSVNTPFYWAGGMADFRPDFVGFCLYGTLLAVVWKSDVFRRHGWALLAGAVGTLCVLSRSLTAVYLGMLLGGCLVVLSVLWLREHDTSRRVDRRRQLAGAALCAACLCVLALPALAVQARTLWNYYVVGHVTGPERAVRAAAMELHGRLDTLVFYPRSALFDHGGWLFLSLSFASIAMLAAGRRAAGIASVPRGIGWFITGALFLPLGALTADTAKSPVVGSVLVMPMLWLVITACTRLAEAASPRVLRILTVGVIAAGTGWHAAHLIGSAPPTLPVESIREALRLHDDFVRWSVARGWPRPVLLTDRQRDYVPAIRVSAYERHGRLLDVKFVLARKVWLQNIEEVLVPLRRSQFVILTRPQPAERYTYPYDETMARLYPQLRAYCERRMVQVGTYRVPNEVDLFARAAVDTANPLARPPGER